MGATLEWDCISASLETPQGTLPFNAANVLGVDGGYFLLRRESCSMGAPLRTSLDDVPAGDGAVPHKVLTSGYRVNLAVELWQHPGNDGTPGAPATGEVLVAMNDLLMRHLNRIRDDGAGRYTWNPSGSYAERMVGDLWWYDDVDPENSGGNDPLWVVSFGLVSPFPYAMLAAEVTTPIANGATETLDNTGSARFEPVIKAYGATSEFTITNETSGKQFHYDSGQPGASSIPGSGAYVELDFFRNTAYLNGNVANRKAGIDPLLSEFWALEIGANDISVDGCDIDVLWQPAFA